MDAYDITPHNIIAIALLKVFADKKYDIDVVPPLVIDIFKSLEDEGYTIADIELKMHPN
tara:strand:+ start:131 stop:307 length:177 start_codon:yes stop_codon:yes gene_type:complete